MVILLTSSFSFIYQTFKTIAYFYIICYYFRLRTNQLNQNIQQLITNKTLLRFHYKLFAEHSVICAQISKFNYFWQKYYLGLIITLVPINLLLFVSLLLTRLETYTIFIFADVLISTWVFIFFISYCASMVSKAIHLSNNRLFLVQIHVKRHLILKLKLMAFMEKVMSNRLITGFSIGNLFVMTFPKLNYVSIAYNVFT